MSAAGLPETVGGGPAVGDRQAPEGGQPRHRASAVTGRRLGLGLLLAGIAAATIAVPPLITPEGKAALDTASPLTHAAKIKRPLLIGQGANDPRVIKPESDEIVAAVKKNGVPVEYVIFPDEGHGFSKKKNQIEAWNAIRAFLDKYLKAPAAKAGG